MLGRIIKNISDRYVVQIEDKAYNAIPRGRLKKLDKLLVGDIVECEFSMGQYIINKRLERKNQFVRPPIANLDILCIVVSQVPLIDKYLVDKLIIKCMQNEVTPILVINKCDIITKEFIHEITDEYYFVDTYIVSAVSGDGISRLKDVIRGKVTAFAGQSAVGKSKLSTALGADALDGELSKKTLRGRHTTRHTEIYMLGDDIFLADTPGFSRLDINDIHYKNLKYYYPEFAEYKCKYSSCVHIEQKICDCGVKLALNDCKINKNRYNRYIQLYNQLKIFWETKYD